MEAKEYYCKENSIKPENLSAEDDENIWLMESYHQSKLPGVEEIEKVVNYALHQYEGGMREIFDDEFTEDQVKAYSKYIRKSLTTSITELLKR